MTNCSLLLTRSKQKAGKSVVIMTLLMGLLCFLVNKADLELGAVQMSVVTCGLLAAVALLYMSVTHDFASAIDTFKVPLVPLVPSLAILVNWFLLAQLSWIGLALTLGLVILALLTYLCYGSSHAVNFNAIEADQVERGVKALSGNEQGARTEIRNADSPEELVDLTITSVSVLHC
jgi:hypothetical protein